MSNLIFNIRRSSLKAICGYDKCPVMTDELGWRSVKKKCSSQIHYRTLQTCWKHAASSCQCFNLVDYLFTLFFGQAVTLRSFCWAPLQRYITLNIDLRSSAIQSRPLVNASCEFHWLLNASEFRFSRGCFRSGTPASEIFLIPLVHSLNVWYLHFYLFK